MTHILLDIKYKQPNSLLYDSKRGESIINSWCEYNNHKLVMPPVSHIFAPSSQELSVNNNGHGHGHGYTSIGILKESHISIHTYPEKNGIQIDFFSCKELNEPQNVQYMERVFKKSDALNYTCKIIQRGLS